MTHNPNDNPHAAHFTPHDPHDPHTPHTPHTPHDDPDALRASAQRGDYPHLSCPPIESHTTGVQQPVPGRQNGTSSRATGVFSSQRNADTTITTSTPTPPTTPPTQTEHELDALADLFLGPIGDNGKEHAPSCTTHVPAKTETRPTSHPIEGVLLGHLPVSVAAWPMQYARVLSTSRDQPVMVVRLAGNTLLIDLVGSCEDPKWPAPPNTCTKDSLEGVLTHARAISCHCIIRVDEVDECCLWDTPGIDSLALLTGSNDAAVVACYRSLKTLASHAQQNEHPLPRLHLVVMGSNQEQSEHIHERIARAAGAFLETSLGDPTIIESLAPTRSHNLYHGPRHMSLDAIVKLLKTVPPGREAPSDSHVPTEPIEQVESASVLTDSHEFRSDLNQSPSAAHSNAPISSDTADAVPPHSPAAAPPSPPAPPAPLARLCRPLVPLESRCPFVPLVELATDAQGRLHLLAASLEKRPELSCTHAVENLLIVRNWAREHASLLVRAEPQLLSAQPPQSDSSIMACTVNIQLHLLTDDMRQARAIAATPILVSFVTQPESAPPGAEPIVIAMQ